MIFFPSEFVQTEYPGYFYNLLDKKLYSIKSGQLKALTPAKRSRFYANPTTKYDTYYVTYSGGHKKYVTREYLESLPYDEHVKLTYQTNEFATIPVNGIRMNGGDPRLTWYYERNFKIIWDQCEGFGDFPFVIKKNEGDKAVNGIYARLSNTNYTFTVTDKFWK